MNLYRCDTIAEKVVVEIGIALGSLPHLQNMALNFGKSMTDDILNELGKELKSIKNLQSFDFDLSEYNKNISFN